MADDRTPVTLIGLGSMGAALAGAFIKAGHPTTVWNRSPQKAEPLVAQGAVHAKTIEDAVTASSLVIACLSTYDATREALAPAAGQLSGRTLITLNTGSPIGAREFSVWASEHGARYLDGAVKNVPQAVGLPDTLLYYSGDKAIFDEHLETLRVLGGDTVHLGEDVDLAALYEMAVGGTLLPALLGFYQGAALLTSRGLEAKSMVDYSVKWLEMIQQSLPLLADEIDRGDYTQPFATVGTFYEGTHSDEQVGAEAGLDMTWHKPINALLERAIAEGHRDHSISALIEILRKPQQ